MEPNLFKYIWQYSKTHQVWTVVVVLASMPFVFLSYELPKMIINGPITGDAFRDAASSVTFLAINIPLPDFISTEPLNVFSGFQLTKLPYLYVLCGVFLALVCINGLFKYYINTFTGRMGERLLRRLRYSLLDRVLRFPIGHFRKVRAPEVATMIKDEVEPLGTFIGEAFVVPLFQGGQALVALLFIVNQNVWLGAVALSVVLGQALLIPRLRRRLLVLTKQRQITARELAGRVGEIVDGIAEIHTNDTSNYERADLTQRLGRIFFIRFELYQRKFFIKFLNNFLAQFTPFLFYLVGGYYAIRGQLDVGALVAVIAAYKDLPSPIREMINWDQQRLDVQIKYTQVIEQFDPDNLAPVGMQAVPAQPVAPIAGDLAVNGLAVTDETGARLVERTSFRIPQRQQVAAVGLVNSGAESTAEVIAGLLAPTTGRIQIGQYDLEEVPQSVTGRRLAYVGADTYLPQGSIFDSLVYGLKHQPIAERDAAARARDLAEAKRAGNAEFDAEAGWIDYAAAGVSDARELHLRLDEVLRAVDLAEDIFEFGLRGTIDPDAQPELAEKVLSARHALRERFDAPELKELVEPFDPDTYTHQATLVENLLSGTAVGDTFSDANLGSNAYMLKVLKGTGLDVQLYSMGRDISQTVTELFAGLAEDHPFFEQLSFMSAEEMPEYEKVMSRTAGIDPEKVRAEDRSMILKLAFAYIEPRHRLGLLDDDMQARIVEARKIFAEGLPEELHSAIEFYDPDRYNRASSLQDNILFGRIAYGRAEGPQRVREEIRTVLRELSLRDEVFEVGLDFNVGTGGKRLTSLQRQKIGMARALLKRPDLLIVNRALASLDARGQETIIDKVLAEARGDGEVGGFSVFWVLQNAGFATKFDRILVFEDGSLAEQGQPNELSGNGSRYAALVA
jgi:putative ABC transport system ATP-binding protein